MVQRVMKNPPANAGDVGWILGMPWSRKSQSAPAFLPGKPHGQRSLAGYRRWGGKELDTTLRLNNNKYVRKLRSQRLGI